MNSQETIICSAIYYPLYTDLNGHFQCMKHPPKNIIAGLVLCGLRHHHILDQARLLIPLHHDAAIQGFMTNENRFVDRKEALEIAHKSGQSKYRESVIWLQSEMIY